MALIRILYIDDSPADRDLVRDALHMESDKFELTEAASREEFESLLTTNIYHLVLSDFNILGFDGLDVLELVRTINPLLPVIIVTGTGSETIAVEAMKQGAADYVIKTPSHIRHLPLTIETVLEQVRTEAQHRSAQEALHLSQTRLHTVMEAMPDLVWLKDPDGVYLSCNRKIEQMFGASAENITGKTDYQFLDQALADSFHRKDMAAIAAGKPLTNEESVVYADDGHSELLETVRTPVYEPDGKLLGVLGVGRDITERVQTEQIMRRIQKMDAIGQLTGGIAHDFNNILGIILGNLDLLKPYVSDNADAANRLSTIQKSAKRAADLTKQLLGFSRRQVKQIAVTDIQRLIRNMENLIARSVTPEIAVKLNFSNDIWLTNIDPGDFEDALLNLIINARDAMPDGGSLVLETTNKILGDTYCKVNPGTTPGEYVQLQVIDNGTGIPAELQDRIFEPFFSTKNQDQGTGLGLAMVYGFVTRSGGQISVNSQPGRGTAFVMHLPRIKGEEQLLETNSKTTEPLPKGKSTILVVDDEEAILELTTASLQKLGYRIITAGNGPQALARLVEEPDISLLFSDVVMPGGMNGYELAEKAQKRRPGIKVLLTSGFDNKQKSTANNPHLTPVVMPKPYSQAELAQRVYQILADTGEK